jgi:uncharacterized protein YegP (UPF0339 family)
MNVILKKSDAAEPFTFAFMDDDGKSILRSENYKAKSGANNGIASVKKNCVNDARYEMKESSNGKFYFNLKSSNGQIVATSAMFNSTADRETCIDGLKNQAADASVDDQT